MCGYKLFSIILPVLLAVCNSTPQTKEPETEEFPEIFIGIEEPYEEEEETSDSIHVSHEVYEQTLAEVRAFIESINQSIRTKNYSRWRSSLSEEYITLISSPEFLAKQSDTPGLKTRKIVLKSPTDYFTYVVVPSRADSRVDEIEFAHDHIVKAYYVDTSRAETRRLRVYELKKIGDHWKIVN